MYDRLGCGSACVDEFNFSLEELEIEQITIIKINGEMFARIVKGYTETKVKIPGATTYKECLEKLMKKCDCSFDKDEKVFDTVIFQLKEMANKFK